MSFVNKTFDILEAIDSAGFFAIVGISLLAGIFYAIFMILIGM